MPGPVYSNERYRSGIDILRTISNSFRLSLTTRKIPPPQQEPESAQKTNKTYLLLLLKKLGDESSSYEERAQSAVEVRQLLDTFGRESIPALWYSAHDLIGSEVPLPAKRAALELLYECIIRCKDASLEMIFFNIIVEHILSLVEQEKSKRISPVMALFLSCLNVSVEELKQLLKSDEHFLLLEIVNDSVTLVGQNNGDEVCDDVILQLMRLIRNLVEPVQQISLQGLLELISITINENHTVNKDFTDGVIDFASFIMENPAYIISNKTLHGFSELLVNLSRQIAEGKEREFDPRFEQLLEDISHSSKNEVFLEQLCILDSSSPKGADRIVEAYTAKFYSNAISHSTDSHITLGEKRLILTLNAHQRKMKDRTLLMTLLRLCQISARLTESTRNYEFWLGDKKNELGLWMLLKLVLKRNDQNKNMFGPKIMNSLLNISLSRMPIPANEMIQFIYEENIAAQSEEMIQVLDMKLSATLPYKTFHLLFSHILTPRTSVSGRLKLWEFIINLVRKNHSVFSSLISSQPNLLSQIYGKSEILEMSDVEAATFGDLIYALIQKLEINETRVLVKERIFADIYQILGITRRRKSIVGAIGNFGRGRQSTEYLVRRLNALVCALVKSFIWSASDRDGFKCVLLYGALTEVYERAERCAHALTLLNVARALVRISCDTNGNIYFKNPSDAVGISSAFGRNKNLMTGTSEKFDWTFPETVSVIDESLLEKHNCHVQFIEQDENAGGKINIGRWLSLAIDTIESPIDLEIYSYLLTHVCGQLSEVTLFQHQYKLIDRFKKVICDHLTNAIPSNISLGDKIGRSDFHSAYVRNLSAVLAYHPYEPKQFADELINALVGGLSSWEKTLIPILHILTVSCFEIPQSIQRYLTPILQHIQKRITSLYAIPSILEFFLALRDSPNVISNLTIQEIKRVFAIIFKLIENSVDLKIRSQLESPDDEVEASKSPTHMYLDYEVDTSPSTESFLIGESLTEFFQYQSFRALSCWFLRLNHNCKLELMPFIMKNMVNLSSIECLKYDATAYMDFFSRSRFGPQKNGISVDDQINTSDLNEIGNLDRWIHGNSLISIRTSTNQAIVTIRKPSCNRTFEMTPLRPVSSQPSYNIFGFPETETDTIEVRKAESRAYSEPEQMLLQLLYVGELRTEGEDSFMKIPHDIAFKRSIGMLDRIPDIEFQKVGIIYVGPSQDTESDVLSNSTGSLQYHWFLNEMGDFVKLSEVSKLFYTGGLEKGTDGEFALVWSDEITQITFHVVTLMPEDQDISMRKRHVGNDLVNIFYHESGLPDFNFNIIKSQFTFISIVISPQTSRPKQDISEHYKIKVYRRTGTPGLLSCTHFKIIRKPNLARYVRHVCLIANDLAQKCYYNHSPDACSIWGVRCKHLSTIRERVIHSRG